MKIRRKTVLAKTYKPHSFEAQSNMTIYVVFWLCFARIRVQIYLQDFFFFFLLLTAFYILIFILIFQNHSMAVMSIVSSILHQPLGWEKSPSILKLYSYCNGLRFSGCKMHCQNYYISEKTKWLCLNYGHTFHCLKYNPTLNTRKKKKKHIYISPVKKGCAQSDFTILYTHMHLNLNIF